MTAFLSSDAFGSSFIASATYSFALSSNAICSQSCLSNTPVSTPTPIVYNRYACIYAVGIRFVDNNTAENQNEVKSRSAFIASDKSTFAYRNRQHDGYRFFSQNDELNASIGTCQAPSVSSFSSSARRFLNDMSKISDGRASDERYRSYSSRCFSISAASGSISI